MTRQQALSLPYTHATYRDGVTEVELPNGARVRFDERWPRLPVTVPKVPAFMSTAKRERTIARDARNEPREGQGVSPYAALNQEDRPAPAPTGAPDEARAK